MQQKQKLAGRVAEELQFFSPSQLFLSVNLHSTLDIRLFQSLAGSIPCGLFSKKIPIPSFLVHNQARVSVPRVQSTDRILALAQVQSSHVTKYIQFFFALPILISFGGFGYRYVQRKEMPLRVQNWIDSKVITLVFLLWRQFTGALFHLVNACICS